MIEWVGMLIFLCLIVTNWLHRWISLKIVKVLPHQTLVTFILGISRVKVSDVRFCRISLVWQQASKPVTIRTHQVILLSFLGSSNKFCHRFWKRVPSLLACSKYLVLFVKLIFLDSILEERSLLCHLSIFWACQIKATQIKLLCLRLCFLHTSSLLIECYQFIDEIIRIVACFSHRIYLRHTFETIRFRWPYWQHIILVYLGISC